MEAFNELSDAEDERLALLAEECAEVIQIVGKILRHGYDSTHPDSPHGPDNRVMLETELGHVKATVDLMKNAGDVEQFNISKSARRKKRTVPIFLHHQ